MHKWLRPLHRHFIPGEHNDHQPHFLRLKTAAAILAIVLLVEGFYMSGVFALFPSSDYFAAIFTSVLVEQTNDVRVTDHLARLTPNPLLEKAARLKALDMAEKGYFSHDTPDGKTPWYWFEQAGYDYLAAGENLAVNFTDSKDVTDAWMLSPTHRANILNGSYTEIGIATAEGTYKGRPAIFVVQEFGLPKPAKIAQRETPVIAETRVVTPSTPSAPRVSPVLIPAPPSPSTTTEKVIAGADTVAAPVAAETKVLAAETETVVDPKVDATPSPVAKVIASPRHLTTTIFTIIGALLLVALGLAIFIKVRVQHPHIIANGILLISIILALLLINSLIGFGAGAI